MKFQVMDHTGHSETCYGEAEVASAMAKFAELTKAGFTAAVRKEGERDYTLTRKLPNELDSEVLFVPQLKGG